ncbi:uncharacterized protein CC84DRAFT_1214920 [Paraphaeosphaeria sporulosa]|uniref:Uncharacterized protein n=1 Tax=Paraphaeosphaeria sporulosa TaxID=1460663 RepID=A0A177CLN0_9PLEO|nr:uncharacterized protein CC84DRAFT_1214920 [Paraphaeosphaeria sporulosa]OAG08423.1 hypothetical protein CC84DRAFT_1214920 [Paraphaeosphaeria sporulosa]
MSSPYANYGTAFFGVEYRVNGLWNNLLSQFYKTGAADKDFIISPEAYPKPDDTKGLKADLLVSSLISKGSGFSISTPMLVYEGKGANGDSFPDIMDQLENWLAEAALLKPFDCWAIGTRGSQVAFLVWQQDTIQWLNWGGSKPIPVSSQKVFDITKDADWNTVVAMLAFFNGNPLQRIDV